MSFAYVSLATSSGYPATPFRRQLTSVSYWASVLENNPILVAPLIKMVQLQDGVSCLQRCRNHQCLSAAAVLEPDWQPTCTCGRQIDWALCLEVRSLHEYYRLTELEYYLCKTTASNNNNWSSTPESAYPVVKVVIGSRSSG